jgi:predicted phosphohydrolase
VGCPILVVAGNHDLWKRDASSRRLWQELLPERTRRTGCIWLEGDAFIHGGVAVAGTIAWYDYSAADPSIEASPQTFASEKRYFNLDAALIDWEWSDPEFAALVAGPFLATLDRLEADPAVRQTVVVTHVPLLECQMCRKPDDRDWGFSNAYFGNLTLGEQVLRRRKVTHVVSGHTHVARQGRVATADGRGVEAWVIDSHYGRPGWLGLTL